MVTSSLVDEENTMLQTCEPESVDWRQLISVVFQSFIDLSVDPPPVARSELRWGDQAKAFMAAVCSVILPMCFPMRGYQTKTRLSFPPEAK